MKKIILILLCIGFSLSLAGCSAPISATKTASNNDPKSTYLAAQKTNSLQPGNISIFLDGNFSNVPLKMDLNGTIDAKGNILLAGTASTSITSTPNNINMFINKNGAYMSKSDSGTWSKTSAGIDSLANIKAIPFNEILNSKKVSKVYDGKNTSVYKYDFNLAKSIERLGFKALLGDAGKSASLKNSQYEIYVDPKTNQIVGLDFIISLDNDGEIYQMKINYTADSKATLVVPTNLD